ncbi:thiamine phosphate synthase, partial [Bacillus sp. WP8]|uniref:thiamine phosphate synthase n=1 Tax=Bacillus sp. WP8 TaxID=756828 RepID=UPI0016428F05
VGEEEGKGEEVRERMGNKILGVWRDKVDEVKEGMKEGGDYVGMGGVYGRERKKDRGSVEGVCLISEVRGDGVEIRI